MSVETVNELKNALREIAVECISRGPGYAQEGVVLGEAREKLRPASLEQEQLILNAWHELFASGEFVWGYDLDNPGSPFFHANERFAVALETAKSAGIE